LGILTSCKHKRELFVACNKGNNPNLIIQYKRYCKIVSRKPKNLIMQIKKSLNKNKTIWGTVNLETNKTENTEEINALSIDGNSNSEHQEIVNAFNKYFLTLARSINTKQNELSSHNSYNTNPLHYLMQPSKNHFPNINLKSISTKAVENIIKPLKPKNSSGYYQK
jgi:hypothetical protein